MSEQSNSPEAPLAAEAPLVETLWALRQGNLRLDEYIEAVCNRLDDAEPRLQALVPEPGRPQRLLQQAADLCRRYPTPDERPPLFGLLVGVKDIFRVEGLETRAGSKLPAAALDGPEASCVSRLKALGALVLGKTATTEFAYFEPAPTRNPYDTGHTPGGSSSGSAAAVAAGYCPLALGTQTIGSVIRPAAYCGVVGFKPSFGRLDVEGMIHCSPSVDHVGLLAQDCGGIALAASHLCCDWHHAEGGQRPVLGVPEGPYLKQAGDEALEAFETQLELLGAFGYAIRCVEVLGDIEAVNARHRRLMAAEMAQVHADWFAEYGDSYRAQTAALVRQGMEVGADEAEAARQGREVLRQYLEAAARDSGVDLWICPAATGPAPAGIEATGDPVMNLPWTHAGLPVLGLPAGRSASGLPLGLQCVGAFGQDEQLLAWGRGLHEDLGLEI